jgi:hypothetical protein
MKIILTMTLIPVFALFLFYLIDCLTHLQMNEGGTFVSLETVKELFSECPHQWYRDRNYKNSAFVKIELPNHEFKSWFLHADLINLGGNRYKLNIISWFRYKHWLKNLDLPYENRS